MKKMILVWCGILLLSNSNAQNVFQKVYVGNFFMQHSQGATTCQNGDYAFITSVFSIVRTDKWGDTLWCKNYMGNTINGGRLIEATNDNGFIVVGERWIQDSVNLVLLLKLDSNGNTLWCKSFEQGDWFPTNVKQTLDGGYILAFRSATPGASSVVKTDSNGNIDWSKEFAFGIAVNLLDVNRTFDGGYILTGYVMGSSFSNILLLRIDSLGNSIWAKRYGGSIPFKSEEGNKVIQTSDEGFVVLGNSFYNGYQNDSLYVIKTNSSGNLIWAKNYGGINNMIDGFGIVALNNNECAIVSSIKDTSTYYEGPSLIRLNENGDTLWTKTFTTGTNSVTSKSLALTNDNGFLIGSHYTGNNGDIGFYLVKTDSNGFVGVTKFI